MKRLTMGAFALVMLAACGVATGGGLKSGPPVGSSDKIKPFNPLHASGAGEGGKACLV